MRTASSPHGLKDKARCQTLCWPTPTPLGWREHPACLAPGVSTLGFALRDEGMYFYHDEINIYGPVHRMGLVTDADGEAIKGMSNMIDDGFLFGIGVMEDDTIVCSITPGGSLSLSKVASSKGPTTRLHLRALETLLDYLPGDSNEFKYRILAASMGLLVLFLGFVVVMVRRSHSEVEELLEEMGETRSMAWS